MKPWKSKRLEIIQDRGYKLQWGHGDEAVEEALAVVVISPCIMLQWGHGDEAVEEAFSVR